MAARSVELLFNMIDLHKGSCHEIIPFELTEGEVLPGLIKDYIMFVVISQ